MEKGRKVKLMVRWSLLTAGIIALFWFVWYLAAGSVPSVSEIKLTEKWTLPLPFAVSRWWDILIGPIWSVILIALFTNEKVRKSEGLVYGLVAGLVFGMVFGLAFGLVFGLAFGLVFGLGAGLVAGLGVGLGAGLVVGIVFIISIFVSIVKFLASKQCRSAVANWLLAKDSA